MKPKFKLSTNGRLLVRRWCGKYLGWQWYYAGFIVNGTIHLLLRRE